MGEEESWAGKESFKAREHPGNFLSITNTQKHCSLSENSQIKNKAKTTNLHTHAFSK